MFLIGNKSFNFWQGRDLKELKKSGGVIVRPWID